MKGKCFWKHQHLSSIALLRECAGWQQWCGEHKPDTAHTETPLTSQQKLPVRSRSCAHLCGRRLKWVVIQGDHLEVPEVPVTDRDHCDLIAREVEAYQRHLCQLYVEVKGKNNH